MRKFISFAMPIRTSREGITFYFQERKEAGALDGKLEFPGGKIEINESPVEACIREFEEEVGPRIAEPRFLQFSIDQFDYEDRQVQLYSFYLEVTDEDQFTDSLISKFIPFEMMKNEVIKLNLLDANFSIVMKFLEFKKSNIIGA
ncbi:NUDIX domain-containing protein [Bacteriovorax sp. Seq25_V]|uniref:NUDIX domain-containing protein n=1 Tax=Bacteriovorax sp. Seq25_V TaxID=1201288 RepID=UPI0018E00147|nr:NUDIX domain-containing protein [Bacteriovorax sp. Seq25_V]